MILECVEGYVEELKGHVSKSLAVHALQSCRLALANSSENQWNEKSLVSQPHFGQVWG
jgi:alcohol dehydrogenase class IV